MQSFKINESTEIVCRSEGTRYGFRHLATLLINGHEVEKNKCYYYNRTWEPFQFHDVIMGLIGKYKGFSITQKREYKTLLNK